MTKFLTCWAEHKGRLAISLNISCSGSVPCASKPSHVHATVAAKELKAPQRSPEATQKANY